MEVKNLYTKNYKILMKKIKKKRTSEKTPSCSWIGRIKIVKMSILPKTKFSAIPTKILMTFFTVIEQS